MKSFSLADLQKHFSEEVKELNPELFGGTAIVKQEGLSTLIDAKGQVVAQKRGNKYGARKTAIGNLVFDSRAEANRYLALRALEEAGQISGLLLQVRIVIIPSFVYLGEKVHEISYTADFVYLEGGKTVIEDCKSIATAKTQAFRLRWRLVQWHYHHRDDVICRVTGA